MAFSSLWANMLNREAGENGTEILNHLSIQAGNTIADIGAGGGYYSISMAKLTGDTGRVYAVDTNRSMLAHIEKLAKKKDLHNIVTLEGKPDGCPLPQNSCDLIFMSKVFHHIENPIPYFQGLKSALKSGGRIAIIDWDKGKGHSHTSFFGHSTPQETIWDTMQKAGYVLIDTFNFLDAQSFNIFVQQGGNG